MSKNNKIYVTYLVDVKYLNVSNYVQTQLLFKVKRLSIPVTI